MGTKQEEADDAPAHPPPRPPPARRGRPMGRCPPRRWRGLVILAAAAAALRGLGGGGLPAGGACFAGGRAGAGRGSSRLPRSAAAGGLSEPQRRRLLALGYREEEVDTMRVDVAESVLTLGTERPWGDKPMPGTWVDTTRKARGGAADQAKAVGLPAKGEVEEVGPFGIKLDKVKSADGEDELEVKVQITTGQILGGVVVAIVLGYFISGFTKQMAGGAMEEYSMKSSPQASVSR